MTDEIRRLIRVRTLKGAKFKRDGFGKKSQLSSSWRKPRGQHNKQREQRKAKGNLPKPGFGSPVTVRGMHPSGFFEVLVHTVADLEGLDPRKQAIRIAANVGGRKRSVIQDKAITAGLRVLNVKTAKKAKPVKKPVPPAKEAESDKKKEAPVKKAESSQEKKKEAPKSARKETKKVPKEADAKTVKESKKAAPEEVPEKKEPKPKATKAKAKTASEDKPKKTVKPKTETSPAKSSKKTAVKPAAKQKKSSKEVKDNE